VGVRYRTVHVRHQDGDLDGALVVISAATPRVPRAGAALRQEDGTWIVTLAGYLEEQPPDDADGLRRFASTVVAPEIGALLDRDLVDAPVGYRFPHAVRRRVEDVTLPQGYAVLGDAISSFNPIFGQGISVAALQAVALGDALGSAAADGGTERVLRRYHQEATRYVDHAWAIATGADLQIPGVVGHRPRGHAAVAAYMRRVQRVAERDPAVAREMIRVAALLDPPPALMRPKVASHVLRAGTPGRGRRLRRRASTAATGARVDHGPGG
jgi:2-polyprenyl-6-methoxyphenol hydroxylase-like FAD-dependent oxidoreductase